MFPRYSFIVDGFIKELNVVIEIFGDFWHMNPKFYEESYKHPVTGWLAKSKWREDDGRLKRLVSLGYRVYRVWECDITQDSFRELAVRIYCESKKC